MRKNPQEKTSNSGSITNSKPKTQPKKRFSSEPITIPNYLNLSEFEMGNTLISRDTQRLNILHYELYNTDVNTFSGKVRFLKTHIAGLLIKKRKHLN